MNCPSCNKNLNNGKYICKEDGYKITDLSDNIIFHAIIDTISGDEIDTYTNIKYCTCGYWK